MMTLREAIAKGLIDDLAYEGAMVVSATEIQAVRDQARLRELLRPLADAMIGVCEWCDQEVGRIVSDAAVEAARKELGL